MRGWSMLLNVSEAGNVSEARNVGLEHASEGGNLVLKNAFEALQKLRMFLTEGRKSLCHDWKLIE